MDCENENVPDDSYILKEDKLTLIRKTYLYHYIS